MRCQYSHAMPAMTHSARYNATMLITTRDGCNHAVPAITHGANNTRCQQSRAVSTTRDANDCWHRVLFAPRVITASSVVAGIAHCWHHIFPIGTPRSVPDRIGSESLKFPILISRIGSFHSRCRSRIGPFFSKIRPKTDRNDPYCQSSRFQTQIPSDPTDCQLLTAILDYQFRFRNPKNSYARRDAP